MGLNVSIVCKELRPNPSQVETQFCSNRSNQIRSPFTLLGFGSVSQYGMNPNALKTALSAADGVVCYIAARENESKVK